MSRLIRCLSSKSYSFVPRRYSTDEVMRALSRIGFEQIRQRGSHIRLRGYFRGATRYVTIPFKRGNQDPKTMSSVLKQAGLTAEELAMLVGGEPLPDGG